MELNEILEKLSVFGSDQPLPREALAEAVRQREAVTPYLLDALDKVYEDVKNGREDIWNDPVYDLSYYALFLLSQFREKRAYPKVLRMLTLDPETLDIVLGDMLTSTGNILYSTYDGDLAPTLAVISDATLDPFARGAALRLLEGLYRDGRLPRETLDELLRGYLEALGKGEDDSMFGGMLISVIADCDLYELAEDVREAFRQEKIDLLRMGDFDGFFDELYNGDESGDETRTIDDTIGELRGWACFRREPEDKPSIHEILSWKVGRNDPCPCGSGKKFKKCCLPRKEAWELQMSRPSEPNWDRYPSLTRQGGRPGLLEFYSQEAIDMDRPVYQAMHMVHHSAHRSARDRRRIDKEAQELLWSAYEALRRKCGEQGLETPEDYDRVYRVHYDCKKWLTVLRDLLEDGGDARYQEVERFLGIGAK